MRTGRRFTRRADGSYDEHYPAWYWWAFGIGIVLYFLVRVAATA
ncbi:MAG TPA: hypothetical protein VJP77_05675 [Planctomycetota bacterium]|nr:hypothetical protein [Planctomycetota bacterium]